MNSNSVSAVFVTNVMASSLDGYIGRKTFESDQERHAYGFSNETDHRRVFELLHHCDAVITGSTSVQAAQKTWEVKNDKGRQPAWIVFTRKGLPKELGFFSQTDVDRILISPQPLVKDAEFLRASKVENHAYQNCTPARFALDLCHRKGWSRVLLFGGGAINQMFYSEKCVDRLELTLCPALLAHAGAPRLVDATLVDPVHFEIERQDVEANLLFLTLRVKK